jgi:hypothetical protein
MPIFLKDLLQDPQLLRQAPFAQQKCCKCGVVLQETITGKRPTPTGDACDCYYDELGVEIERHPIASAGIRRG